VRREHVGIVEAGGSWVTERMMFDSWYQVGRVMVAALVAYVGLIAFLRISGKRTLAKLNAFDLVVTVALGSTLATITLAENVALLEGIVALVTLIALQHVAAWLSVRLRTIRILLKSEPVLVVRDGSVLHDTLRANRLTESELFQAVRSSGVGDLDLVAAVVLETDGTLSVVARNQLGSGQALASTGWSEATRFTSSS
jgi:uncharacterized membrane protein YcaP (DUF421 family)